MLVREKLERAKVILAKSNLTVREVAHQLGFNNGWREFSDAYKAHFHESPTAHRQETRRYLWNTAFKPKAFSVQTDLDGWTEQVIHKDLGADDFDQVDLIAVEAVSIKVGKKKYPLNRDALDPNTFYRTIDGRDYRVAITPNTQSESLRAKVLLDGLKHCSKINVSCVMVANVAKRRASEMPLTFLEDLRQGDLFFQPDRRDGLVFMVSGVGENKLYLKCLNRNWEGSIDYSGSVLMTERDDDGLTIQYFDRTVTRPTGIVKFPKAKTA